VLAEAEAPGRGGAVEAEIVERAAALVDFSMDCFRALPEQGALALSRRDAVLDQGIDRLIDYLEGHGGVATRRDLQQAHVAGCRTSRDLDALLDRYSDSFPGCVVETTPERGGLPTIVVKAPIRRASLTSVSPLATPTEALSSKTHEQTRSDGVDTGYTDVGVATGYTAESEQSGSSSNEWSGPLLSDPKYLDWLFARFERGEIDADEWHVMERAHRDALALIEGQS
jgi:hypothetical protein